MKSNSFPRLSRFTAYLLAWGFLLCGNLLSAQPLHPEIRVEYFGPERGYTLGMQQVRLRCVLRNVGTSAIPEKTLRLRCYTVAGLDYTAGDTLPLLPALERNQAVVFQWRFNPSTTRGPLIAGLLIEKAPAFERGAPTGGPSTPRTDSSEELVLPANRAFLSVIPRLATSPRLVTPAKILVPFAEADEDVAQVGNERVAVQITATDRRTPVLSLFLREGTSWKTLASGAPLLTLLSGEEGQNPWNETFRWRNSRVEGDKEQATLTLVGTLGSRWKAEIILEARRNTGAINGKIRLIAARQMRCSAVQLPRLLVDAEANHPAVGTPVPVGENTSLMETTPAAAFNRNEVTFGLTWGVQPPLVGWQWYTLPVGDGTAPTLGVEWRAGERSAVILPGATVEFPFRFFAYAPSGTLQDALRFALAP